MSYEEFVSEMEGLIKRRTNNRFSVVVQEKLKNNGRKRLGMQIWNEEVNLTPVIYLEEFYEKYRAGAELEELAQQILELHETMLEEKSVNLECLEQAEFRQSRIVFRLINREKNAELLQDCPSMPWHDLAIVFYVLLDTGKESHYRMSMLIRKEHAEDWGMTVEELYESAMVNTPKLFPYECSDMSSLVLAVPGDYLQGEVPEVQSQKMYVLSNKRHSYGAAAILYPERLEQIGLYLGENYYIVPSSVHEMIIIGEGQEISEDRLNLIIGEVNGSNLIREEEYLSDHAYYYDRKKACVRWTGSGE